jgi:hypothetical protein
LLSKNVNIRIYRILILPVILYVCETWSITFREKLRLRVVENRVLRRILVSKRDELTWKWRKLHNEELNDLYSSTNIFRVIKSRRMRSVALVARMAIGEAYIEFYGKHGGSRPLGKPRRKWKDNIKVHLQNVGWGGPDCIDLAQDRDRWRAVVNGILNFRVP